LERGKRGPELGTILKLAGALDVEPDELFLGIAWRPPSGGREGAFCVRDRKLPG
jgi:transcriptional regulator with XRE-family HTH domain